MKNMGLIFKDEGTGFSILYDVHRDDSLLEYLRRQVWPEGSKHCWTHLSFVLSITNPYFFNFTELPIDLNPLYKNFYFTNQKARRQPGGEILLNPGPEEQELLTIVPVQVGVEVLSGIKEVEVQDIAQAAEGSKETVICKPRCVPSDLLKIKSPAEITCAEAEVCKSPGDPKCKCTNKLYLDFSTLPEDKYIIKRVFYPSVFPIAPPDETVLYTESYPPPFCFINLFFTSPTGERPKLFPVRNLFDKDKTTIEAVNYELRFERRKTYWNYFIVPQTGESVESLRIEGEPGIKFNGPCCVYLPNNTKAYRFVSIKPLPFIQQSPFRFRLTGKIGLASQTSTLVDRLPVASAEQVLQDEVTACLRLQGNICRGAKGECRKLKRQICGRVETEQQSSQSQKPVLNSPRIYSDTYVYV
ncbi:MAG: hypothetical protein WBP93_18665 [Pyrinomonadaceae bacterium]